MSYFSDIARDISRSFSPELPEGLGTLDQHLDFILPHVTGFGEDVREPQFWQSRRWAEVRDEDGFHESILHVFNPGGEYLLVLDGNIIKGTWKQLGNYNSLIIEINGRSELFDVRFLNGLFLVLTKHGDQVRKGFRKYFLLVHEPAGRMDWRNLMETMFNIYRERSTSIGSWIFFIIVLAVIIFLSVR